MQRRTNLAARDLRQKELRTAGRKDGQQHGLIPRKRRPRRVGKGCWQLAIGKRRNSLYSCRIQRGGQINPDVLPMQIEDAAVVMRSRHKAHQILGRSIRRLRDQAKRARLGCGAGTHAIGKGRKRLRIAPDRLNRRG